MNKHERQWFRNKVSGRYAATPHCEICGKNPKSARWDYLSDDRCNNVFQGRGLVLCGACASKLMVLNDEDGKKLLGV